MTRITPEAFRKLIDRSVTLPVDEMEAMLEMRDELIALRQVAREACKLVDPYADDPSWERTRDALKAVGW